MQKQTRKHIEKHLKRNKMNRAQLERECGLRECTLGWFMRGDHNLGRKNFKKVDKVVGFDDVHWQELCDVEAARSARTSLLVRESHLARAAAKDLTAESPCDTCRFHAACSTRKLACDAYKFFLNAADPSFRRDMRKAGISTDWKDHTRYPSHKVYLDCGL